MLGLHENSCKLPAAALRVHYVFIQFCDVYLCIAHVYAVYDSVGCCLAVPGCHVAVLLLGDAAKRTAMRQLGARKARPTIS